MTATKERRPSLPSDKVNSNTTLFEFLLWSYRQLVATERHTEAAYAKAHVYGHWSEKFRELLHKTHGTRRYMVFVKMTDEQRPDYIKEDEAWWEVAAFDHIEDAYARALTIIEETPDAEVSFGVEEMRVYAPGRHVQKIDRSA